MEILIVHCCDFGMPGGRIQGIESWKDSNVVDQCPEDPLRNHIMGDDAFVSITSDHEGEGEYRHGHWVRSSELPSQEANNGLVQWWYTRCQPKKCQNITNLMAECQDEGWMQRLYSRFYHPKNIEK